VSCSNVATVGAAEIRQLPPVRCRISLRWLSGVFGSAYAPTAHTEPPAAVTPERSLAVLRLGVVSRVHVVPFQWTARVS